MKPVSGTSGAFAPFAVYTVDPGTIGRKAYAYRQLGCAFPISQNGLLATCGHVVDELNKDSEALVAQHPLEDRCHHAQNVARHPIHDFALLEVEAKYNAVPTPILAELSLATDSFAYGYYDCTVDNGEISIIPQVFSGTITATPRRFKLQLETMLPFYQLSFPCLPGFSGSPLYSQIANGHALSGMVFGNERSEIIERVVTEYDDGSGRVIEKVGRAFESGVAHTCTAIRQFCADLGYTVWGS